MYLYLNGFVQEGRMKWSEIESAIFEHSGTDFHRKYFSRLKDGTLQFQNANRVFCWITEVVDQEFTFENILLLLEPAQHIELGDLGVVWASLPRLKKKTLTKRLGLDAIGITATEIDSIDYFSPAFKSDFIVYRLTSLSATSGELFFFDLDGELIWLDQIETTTGSLLQKMSLHLTVETILDFLVFYNLFLRPGGKRPPATRSTVRQPSSRLFGSQSSCLEFEACRRPAVVAEMDQGFVCDLDVIHGNVVYRERFLISRGGIVDVERLERTMEISLVSAPRSLPLSASVDFERGDGPAFTSHNESVRNALFKEMSLSFTGLTLKKTIELYCDKLFTIVSMTTHVIENPDRRSITVLSPDIATLDIELLTFYAFLATRRFEQNLLGFKVNKDQTVFDFASVAHAKNIDALFFAFKSINEMEPDDRRRYNRIIESEGLVYLERVYRSGWSTDEVVAAYSSL